LQDPTRKTVSKYSTEYSTAILYIVQSDTNKSAIPMLYCWRNVKANAANEPLAETEVENQCLVFGEVPASF